MFNLLSPAGDLLDASAPVILWVTVAILGAIIVAGLIVYFCARTSFGKFAKYELFGFLVYALVAGIYMLSLTIAKYYGANGKYTGEDVASYVFIPIVITLALILVFAVTAFFSSKTTNGALKTLRLVTGAASLVAVIVTLVMIAVYFNKDIKGDGYYDGYGKLNSAALYISAVLLVAAAVATAFVVERKDKSGFDSRSLAFAGVSVAMSFALSYVKMWEMPQGGSITLASMLPIMIFAYVYGAKKGLLVGFVYGLLQAVQDPYIVHPAQFLLDYPIAFGLVGMTGILRNVKFCEKLPQVKFAVSSVIGAVLRFISHVLSGVFAFGAYAVDNNMPLLPYSLAYNSFVFVDLAIVIVVGVILFSSKGFNAEMNKLAPKAPAAVSAAISAANAEVSATEAAEFSTISESGASEKAEVSAKTETPATEVSEKTETSETEASENK